MIYDFVGRTEPLTHADSNGVGVVSGVDHLNDNDAWPVGGGGDQVVQDRNVHALNIDAENVEIERDVMLKQYFVQPSRFDMDDLANRPPALRRALDQRGYVIVDADVEGQRPVLWSDRTPDQIEGETVELSPDVIEQRGVRFDQQPAPTELAKQIVGVGPLSATRANIHDDAMARTTQQEPEQFRQFPVLGMIVDAARLKHALPVLLRYVERSRNIVERTLTGLKKPGIGGKPGFIWRAVKHAAIKRLNNLVGREGHVVVATDGLSSIAHNFPCFAATDRPTSGNSQLDIMKIIPRMVTL